VSRGDVKAWVIDKMTERTDRQFGAQRRDLLAEARGRVLEIGAGTGANLRYYPEGVEELVLLEPSEPFARRIQNKLDDGGRQATIVSGRAESLPFEDASFDTVVVTFVLCTVKDQTRALAEARRVLKPNGVLLFAEHVRAEDQRLARWQDRLNRPWGRVADGCNCNRETVAALEASPFEVDRLERGRLPKAPPIVRPLVVGRARPRL
jgi:ubiquinone/menaquinone biosynthesis C-methylase UbiE